MLRCQIRIEPARRPYGESEQEKLSDLFGEPARWSQTLHSMLWTHSNVVIPPFQGSTTVDLPVACTFDLTVASAKYFNGLEHGRSAAVPAVQRNHLPPERRGRAADRADPVDQGGPLRAAGASVAAVDGLPLSQPGVALPAPRRLRAAEPI